MLKIFSNLIFMTFSILTYLSLVISLPIVVFFILLNPYIEPIRCDRPEMAFGDHIYRVELCIQSDFDLREEYFRLRVFHHEKDELLARRRFMMLMDYDQEPIRYLDAGILYTDAMDTLNREPAEVKFLTLPPSRWDWFTANLIRIAYEP